MPQAPLAALLEYLGKTCAVMELESLTDASLLERFVRARDEAAFAVLMHRHGPMVFGVCRRMLGDDPEADDAFQATFVVLARRAESVVLRPQESLAGWLYGVARRVASKARARAAARRHRQRELTDMPGKESLDAVTWQELRPILDEEVGRLPEKIRAPIVLCYFEGKSYDQAAQELGWPKSTLASRLARGRDLLRQRLVKRGITLSAGAVTATLAEQAAPAGVAARLTINTVKAAASVAVGKPLAQGVLSDEAVALAEEAMKTMTGIKGKVLALLLALGLAAGTAFAGYEAWLRPTPPEQQQPAAVEGPGKKGAVGPAVDVHGDPLPAGAVARMGQDRWLHDALARFAAFTPDKKIVTVSVDGTIRVWDFPSGKEIRRIALPARNLTGTKGIPAALSKDGKTLATWLSEEPSAIFLYDLATGKQLPPLKVTSRPSSLTFSPDGVHLACMSPDCKVGIWNWAEAKEVCTFVAGKPVKVPRAGGGGSMFFKIPEICYAPDGKAVATLVGKQVTLWNPATGAEIKTLRSEKAGDPLTIAYSPDGKMLAISIAVGGPFLGRRPTPAEAKYAADAVVLVDPATGKRVCKLALPQGRHFSPTFGGPGLVFTRDTKRLYLSNSGNLYGWDIATRQLLHAGYFWAQSTSSGASLSPDGNVLVRTGYGPPLLGLGGKKITLLPNRAAPIVALQLTANGKHLLTTSPELPHWYEAPSARRWDAATGQDLGKVDLHGLSDPVAISPNNKFLGGGSRIVEAASGKELPLPARLTHGTDYIHMALIRFSPDSKMLAFALPLAGRWRNGPSQGTRIGLYDLSAAKLRHTLEVHDEPPPPENMYGVPQTVLS
jgi:RNA polymerase sigma factor (sigma-70 family)